MDFYWSRVQLLANTGGKNHYGVLMVDYRGYGLSEGKPTEEGLYADVDARLQWLKTSWLSNERLVMYGFSLGSAPATKSTAAPPQPHAFEIDAGSTVCLGGKYCTGRFGPERNLFHRS